MYPNRVYEALELIIMEECFSDYEHDIHNERDLAKLRYLQRLYNKIPDISDDELLSGYISWAAHRKRQDSEQLSFLELVNF